MTVRKILIAPDKRLKQRSSPVDIVDDKIRLIVNDMFETMYAADGLGLAAIQIGIPIRIIVADVNNKNEKPNPLCLINPEILQISSNTMLHEEGCLSLPEQFERVERPSTVKIQYLDNEGKSCEIEATGVLSVGLQHEIDHLEGTLFVDPLSTLKRRIILRKLIKEKKIEGEVLGQPHHKK